jgi:hypothetical protein
LYRASPSWGTSIFFICLQPPSSSGNAAARPQSGTAFLPNFFSVFGDGTVAWELSGTIDIQDRLLLPVVLYGLLEDAEFVAQSIACALECGS